MDETELCPSMNSTSHKLRDSPVAEMQQIDPVVNNSNDRATFLSILFRVFAGSIVNSLYFW